MDNSQSSDFIDYDSCYVKTRDQFSYESLLIKTKAAFDGFKNEIQESTFSTYFAAVLEDSWTCITHNLDNLIRGLLSNADVQINRIIGYLNDSVYLLQMLSNVYKSIIESASISYCSMKTLPGQTGLIILSVFVHCRDSESLYRHHLKSVEKQLKDLFRICHELQLTYLQILEKKMSFDSSDLQDKTILVEALKINLSIGQVVQSLDVKTMAEQWKSYTQICEKYSNNIIDTDIFQDCSKVLCTLIKDSIDTAIEKDQDEKLTVRSFKVASFTIKILIKIYNTLKLSSNKNYSYIMELLQYIAMKNTQYLEMSVENTLACMNTNIMAPTDCFLKELLLDEEFITYILNLVSSCEDLKSHEDLLGLILIITTCMKCTTQTNRRHQNHLKTKLVKCIYSLLPYSHTLFRRRLFESNKNQGYSIFEHMLTHTTALALTMSNEEFNALEKNMIHAILDTDCVNALFSSNLWLLLANYINPQLLFNQLIWLCTMYKKLDVDKGFCRSPQGIHLTHTLSRLFKVLEDEDKLKFCKQFRIHDDDNMSLWTALRIESLPEDSQQKAEEAIAEKLKTIFGQLDSPDLLVQITNLAATCSFKTTRRIDEHLVMAWSKACPAKHATQRLDNETVWFYDYVKALVSLTDSVIVRFREKSVNLVKILHVISALITTGDTEMKLILTNTLCKLTSFEVNEHKNLTDSYFTEAFISLLKDPNELVQFNLVRLLRYKQNKQLNSMVLDIVRENALQETLEDLNERYDAAKDFDCDSKYMHKCLPESIEISAKTVHELKKANVDDIYFDSASFKMLTEIDEPSCKRGKTNTHEVDRLIKSLEESVTSLAGQTYTNEQLGRIQKACQKLLNISN